MIPDTEIEKIVNDVRHIADGRTCTVIDGELCKCQKDSLRAQLQTFAATIREERDSQWNTALYYNVTEDEVVRIKRALAAIASQQ